MSGNFTNKYIPMNYLNYRQFLIEVQKENVAGHSMVHKFGRNDAVPNGSWAHVSLLPFNTANFRTSPVAMRIKSGGNAADTAAGAGAREITIQGIDSNFFETSESITTAGASASSATTKTFWRIHRAWVSATGTYTAANTGSIVIENSTGGTDFITIAAGEGQTQYTGWTVPARKTAYLLSVHTTVDSNKSANVRLFTRKNINTVSAPMEPSRLKLFWDGLTGSFSYRPFGPELSIPEKSDIWFEAYGDGAASQVSIDFELLVVDDE